MEGNRRTRSWTTFISEGSGLYTNVVYRSKDGSMVTTLMFHISQHEHTTLQHYTPGEHEREIGGGRDRLCFMKDSHRAKNRRSSKRNP